MASIEKERIDTLLVVNNFCETREIAKKLIMAGLVNVGGMRCDKPGTKVPVNSEIVVISRQLKYVSRGGYKLEKAIECFNISCKDLICLDIGASTGGFTDCMLQNGAKKVTAVDVGYGQFAWKLRNDPRVTILEKTNARYLTKEQIVVKADFASIDVSFISLSKILSPLLPLLNEDAKVVALIKPQFEAGREKVGKKGVVREKVVHIEVIENILQFASSIALIPIALTFSPIKGPEGNIEYLLYLSVTPVIPATDESFHCNELQWRLHASSGDGTMANGSCHRYNADSPINVQNIVNEAFSHTYPTLLH